MLQKKITNRREVSEDTWREEAKVRKERKRENRDQRTGNRS